MAPFKSSGARARWREIYDHAAELKPGDIITYDTLTELLGYNPAKQGASRTPIARAGQELLTKRSRMLIAVRGVGYKIAHASEHEVKARGYQKSARRRMRSAVATTTHVDRNELSIAQRKSIDAFTDALVFQASVLDRHETQIADLRRTVTQVDDKYDVLVAALQSQGISVPDRVTVAGETVDENTGEIGGQ